MQAEGDRSEYVATTRRDFEAQARAERDSIRQMEEQGRAPVRLPTADDVVQKVFELGRRFGSDPVSAREEMRAYLRDGRIRVEPQSDDVYVAKLDVLPLAVMLPLPGGPGGGRVAAFVAGAGFEPSTLSAAN